LCPADVRKQRLRIAAGGGHDFGRRSIRVKLVTALDFQEGQRYRPHAAILSRTDEDGGQQTGNLPAGGGLHPMSFRNMGHCMRQHASPAAAQIFANHPEFPGKIRTG
jgi:hypothetical protein